MFLTPDFSWVINSTNPTSLALPFTLLPHSIFFIIKKFGRKHWAPEHDSSHTSFPLSFSLSSKPVSVSILVFSFFSPRNWSVSQVCMVLGFPFHSASFQSRCLKVRVTFDQIAGWSLHNGGCPFPLIIFFPTLFRAWVGKKDLIYCLKKPRGFKQYIGCFSARELILPAESKKAVYIPH